MADATGPARFGAGPALAVGVELELLLVDPVTHALVPDAEAVLARAAHGERAGGVVKPDTYAAEVELVTPPCPDAGAAGAALRGLRDRVVAAGATPLGAGIHPDAPFGAAEHHPDPRYRAIAASMRGLMRRTPTCALHVHVGMPDADAALRAFNGLRPHLPLLQALAANSPFWHGRDSGLASARAQLFRALPRAELPPAFASLDAWASVVEAICAQGDAPDYTFLWWDLRLHPRVGTVEVRAMDAQARLDDAVGLAALVHGLGRLAAEGALPGDAPPPREALAEQSFLAARDGVHAVLGGVPVPELAHRALALARAGGAGDELELVERLVAAGGGAGRQRAAHARGGMAALLAQLVADAGR